MSDNEEESVCSLSQAKYCCIQCSFATNRKSNYDRHMSSERHRHRQMTPLSTSSGINVSFQCDSCFAMYHSQSGLWKHKQKCTSHSLVPSSSSSSLVVDRSNNNNNNPLEGIINQLIHHNSQMSLQHNQIIMEVIKHCTTPSFSAINHATIAAEATNCNNTQTIHHQNNHVTNSANNTTSNNTNNSNNSFNLNVFLNETCKNAMTIDDFVESIKLELSDLEHIGKVGYTQCISDIIISNLNKLDITKRPIHCTDKKRETIYVKKPDVWEKDDENKSCVRGMIRSLARRNYRLLPLYKEQHPDCFRSSSRVGDQYNRIILECTKQETFEEDAKIIRKICNHADVGEYKKSSSPLVVCPPFSTT